MALKVLLIHDVEHTGRSGDIVTINKHGYFRNYLGPKGLGVVASASALRRQKALQETRAIKAAADRAESEKLAKSLEGLALSVEVKVDPEGGMYGSVTAHDIVHMMKDQLKIEIEKQFVVLKHAIKTTGSHAVELRLPEGVSTTVAVNIIPEAASAEHVKAPEEASAEEAPRRERRPRRERE